MKDFFDLLNEFLKSDLAKNYWWFFVVATILIIVITAYLTWLFLSKICYKIELNKMDETKTQNARLVEQVQKLQEDNVKLKESIEDLEKKLKLCEFSAVLDAGETSDDPAFERFIRKK